MSKTTIVGIDLAKNVFHVVCCNRNGQLMIRKKLRRNQVTRYFSQLNACTVAMEACGSSHHWARQFLQMGHCVKMIPAQFVKPFLRGNKTDYHDAQAIVEAARQPEMRFTQVKTIEQQDMQGLIRAREFAIKSRTALCNHLRGLVAEYGVDLPRGRVSLFKQLPRLLSDERLSEFFRQTLEAGICQLLRTQEYIDTLTEELHRHSRELEASRRLCTIPGFGVIIAAVFLNTVGNGATFRRGRDVSASLGLVPKQHSTGGKTNLQGISKRGDGTLRSLLIHGARAVVCRAGGKTDRHSQWINRRVETRGFNRAVVAYANKMARMGWAILRHDSVYRDSAASASAR